MFFILIPQFQQDLLFSAGEEWFEFQNRGIHNIQSFFVPRAGNNIFVFKSTNFFRYNTAKLSQGGNEFLTTVSEQSEIIPKQKPNKSINNPPSRMGDDVQKQVVHEIYLFLLAAILSMNVVRLLGMLIFEI